MAFGFTYRVCEAIAEDFLAGAVNLEVAPQEEGVTYQIERDGATFRTQYPDGRITLHEKMSPADFVGGVTFALAERGEIPLETANPQNVARVSYILGQLTARSFGEIE